MKKTIVTTVVGLAVAASSCMLPLASKNFQAYDAQAKGTRIQHTKQGALLIFSLIPTGDPMDLKTELDKMKDSNGCRELKNIDTQYYDYSFYIVGFEKVLIKADCIK